MFLLPLMFVFKTVILSLMTSAAVFTLHCRLGILLPFVMNQLMVFSGVGCVCGALP